MAGGERISIGDWIFTAQDGTLVRGAQCRRLEHRAAAVLQLLAERRGTVVKQQELIDAIWAGRAISGNSVAVTIADIRKALEDDARAPRFIETVPKRGYRLTEQEIAGVRKLYRHWFVYAFVIAAVASLGLLVGIPSLKSSTPPMTMSIASFDNETRSSAFDPLVASVHELAVTDLGTAEGIQIVPVGSSAELTVNGKLIMWSGHPSVAFSVQDSSRKNLVWTGMAPGPEHALPAQTRALMADLVKKLRGSSP